VERPRRTCTQEIAGSLQWGHGTNAVERTQPHLR